MVMLPTGLGSPRNSPEVNFSLRGSSPSQAGFRPNNKPIFRPRRAVMQMVNIHSSNMACTLEHPRHRWAK